MSLRPYQLAAIALLASNPLSFFDGPSAVKVNDDDDEPQLVIDFRYLMSGNCYAFTPATQAARDWARKDETMQALGRMNAAYVVEKQDFGTIVDLIDSAGFFFTKGA